MTADFAPPRRLRSLWLGWAALPSLVATTAIADVFFRFSSNDAVRATLVIALIAGAAAIVLRRRHYRQVQQDRDRFARELGNYLLAGGDAPPPFSLYLRPFFTDGLLTADEGLNAFDPFDPANVAELGQRRDVERAAAQALQDHAPLVALGKITSKLGAGKIETQDESWRQLFWLLARHAKRIVMVPIAQPSTLTEIQEIAGTPELLSKTVFVRPANRIRFRFRFAPDTRLKSVRSMWRVTRDALKTALPAFEAFSGGTRLIVFKTPGEAIKWYGNGLCSVQLASGVADFLRRGVLTPRIALVLAIWVPTIALLQLAPYDAFAHPSEIYPVEVIGRYLANVVHVGTLFALGLYALITGDRPFRAALRLGWIFIAFTLVQSLYFPWSAAAQADMQLASARGLLEQETQNYLYGWTRYIFGADAFLGERASLIFLSWLAMTSWWASLGALMSSLYQMRLFWTSLSIGAIGAAVFLFGLNEPVRSVFAGVDRQFLDAWLADSATPIPFELFWLRPMAIALVVGAVIAGPLAVAFAWPLDATLRGRAGAYLAGFVAYVVGALAAPVLSVLHSPLSALLLPISQASILPTYLFDVSLLTAFLGAVVLNAVFLLFPWVIPAFRRKRGHALWIAPLGRDVSRLAAHTGAQN